VLLLACAVPDRGLSRDHSACNDSRVGAELFSALFVAGDVSAAGLARFAIGVALAWAVTKRMMCWWRGSASPDDPAP